MIPDLEIKKGEHPLDAHFRLTQAAFFPVRKVPLFFRGKTREMAELPRHLGILDEEREEILSVVTRENYELVTNKEAFDLCLGRIVPAVFPGAKEGDFLCNGVVMPNSRGFCHMDLCCDAYSPPIPFDDVWMPFIRVTNSYNKTYKLAYKLGFCNRSSNNRVIFCDRSISLASVHNLTRANIERTVAKNFEDMSVFAESFYHRLLLLQKYYFPRKKMLALFCKAFGRQPARTGKGEKARRQYNHAVVAALQEFMDDYCGAQGENAYAAFCVLTAFATSPVSRIAPENEIDRLQSLVGAWTLDFAMEAASPTFNRDAYLGPEALTAAREMVADYNAVEADGETPRLLALM